MESKQLKCECDKSCDIGEYLDYWNCKCRKKLVDRLVEECTESIDGVENEHENKDNSCILYTVLFTLELVFILFTTNTWVIIKKCFWIWLHLSNNNLMNAIPSSL